jgi:hypothetical protein
MPSRRGADAAAPRRSFSRTARESGLMTVRLRVSEPELASGLAFFLGRHECSATVSGGGVVDVDLPHLLHDEQARLELDLYVRLWEVLHGVRVEAIDDEPA